MQHSNDLKPERWQKLDLLRFFCSVLVVYTHTGFPGTVGYALTAISRIAVPLFFIISGFFFMNNVSKNKGKKRLMHTAKLMLIGSGLYFLLWCFSQVIAGRSLGAMLQQHVTGQPICNMLLWNQPLFGEHLWYLFAYFYIILIIPVLRHKNLQFFSLFLVVGSLLLGTYSPVIFERNFDVFLSRNWIFTGIPFVALGMVFSNNKELVMRQKDTKPIWLGILLLGICTIVEAAILRKAFGSPTGDMYISTVLLSVFVFAYTLDNKNIDNKWMKALAGIGEKHSLWIYILHPLISALLDKALEIVLHIQLVYTKPLIVYLATLILLVLLEKATKKLQIKSTIQC